MASIVWQRQGLPWAEVCRRAGARRKWNERRRALARQRQALVEAAWLASAGTWGWQAALARQLGVHRSTVTRALQAVRADWGL
jgi:DNA invertase Pin-like site-specific DNA recombinase